MMVKGFQQVMEELVQRRIEEIINSTEFISISEAIEHDLEEKLKQLAQLADDVDKLTLISDFKDNIFEQVYLQSTIAYKTAFNDALIFAVDTLMAPKKI